MYNVKSYKYLSLDDNISFFCILFREKVQDACCVLNAVYKNQVLNRMKETILKEKKNKNNIKQVTIYNFFTIKYQLFPGRKCLYVQTI